MTSSTMPTHCAETRLAASCQLQNVLQNHLSSCLLLCGPEATKQAVIRSGQAVRQAQPLQYACLFDDQSTVAADAPPCTSLPPATKPNILLGHRLIAKPASP